MAGRILFIDQLDNELMDLKLSLEAAGIQVTVQPNPKQAIDDAKLKVPDLVVIEVLTRPAGGLEFASTITLGKHGFKAPVIFYTAFYRDERARRDITEKYGALHYFVKPFQREALRKAIFSVLEQSSHSRSETQSRSRTNAPEEVLPFKPVNEKKAAKLTPISEPATPQEVLPFKSVDEKEAVTHTPISEPATAQQALIVQPPSPEPPPMANVLTSLEPIKQEPEVEDQLEAKAPVAPVKVTTLKMYPKSPKVWAKDEKPKIQTPPATGKLNPGAPLRVDPKVSQKPKGAETRTVLPPRPVKKMTWNWAKLALLIFVSFAVLYWIWYRYGHSSQNLSKDPAFESNGSSSSDFPPSNSTSAATESSRENDPQVHESAAENSTKSPSAAPARVENPPKLPSEPGKETPGQNATLSPRAELVVSDLSVSIREPQLVHMKKVALSDEDLGDMGGETFVVRVVIDGKGKVREVTQLKKNTVGASLPQSVVDSIWEWEFRPVAKREGQFFVKHYSFKVAHP